MAFGLTSTGFVAKRFSDVVSSLQTRAQSVFGPDINVTPESVFGQLISTLSYEIAGIWELGEATYNAYNPLTAEGQQLDDLCAEVGITRQAAAGTRVQVEYIGDVGTTITTSAVVSNTITGDLYQASVTDSISISDCSEATIEVTTVADATLYTININGNLVSYTSGVAATDITIAAGLKAAFDAVTALDALATCEDNLDGTLTITLLEDFLTLSTRLAFVLSANLTAIKAAVVIESVCTTTGIIYAPAGKITTIETTISGLDSVRNRVDGVVGRDIETDTELRLRRIISLKQASAATKDAILAEVLEVNGVSAAYLYENLEDIEVDDRPGHSFEVIVAGGDDQDIADAIWRVKPAGIQTTNRGSAAGVTVTDSVGDTHTIYFSRPSTKRIYVNVTYTLFDEEIFPAGGASVIAQAVADYGNALAMGKDVIPKRFYGSIYSAVPGLDEVTVEVSDDGITYVATKLSIESFETPEFDLGDISVTLA